jgi:hypothetical protein
VKRHGPELFHRVHLEPHPVCRDHLLKLAAPDRHGVAQVLHVALRVVHADQREVILDQVVQAVQMGFDLRKGFGHHYLAVWRRLHQFFGEQVYMQKDRAQRVADFVRHPSCQTAQQGEVFSPLGFLFQGGPR